MGYVRSSTQNVDPSFTFDCTPRRPPLSLTIWRTSARPSPVPFPPCSLPCSVWLNAAGRARSALKSATYFVKMTTYRTVCSAPCPSAEYHIPYPSPRS